MKFLSTITPALAMASIFAPSLATMEAKALPRALVEATSPPTSSPTDTLALPTSNRTEEWTSVPTSTTTATRSPADYPGKAKASSTDAQLAMPTAAPSSSDPTDDPTTSSPTSAPTVATSWPTFVPTVLTATLSPDGHMALVAAKPSPSPTKACPEDVSLLGIRGVTDVDLGRAVEILEQNTTTVTVRLSNAWARSSTGTTIDSIFYTYQHSTFDEKCYQKDDVPGGDVFVDEMTIWCFSGTPVAKLRICVADGGSGVLDAEGGDSAAIPRCCHADLDADTPSVCYTILVRCETACHDHGPADAVGKGLEIVPNRKALLRGQGGRRE